jgi:hypothetical protein
MGEGEVKWMKKKKRMKNKKEKPIERDFSLMAWRLSGRSRDC